ncbi:hypothetical protein MMC31_000546 [Peltigera leucophlebia]|nr:hypothetical protein [Peltigera leucophlebia]
MDTCNRPNISATGTFTAVAYALQILQAERQKLSAAAPALQIFATKKAKTFSDLLEKKAPAAGLLAISISAAAAFALRFL